MEQVRHVSIPTNSRLDESKCRGIWRSSAFRKLKKRQAGRIVSSSTCKRVDSVFLDSNDPMEDRFAAGVSENLNFSLFSIIDGHRGHECAHHLQDKLNQQISKALHESIGIEDDFKVLLDLDQVTNPNRNVDVARFHPPQNTAALLSSSMVKKCLTESFISVDEDFSKFALRDVNAVHDGHPLTSEMQSRIAMAAVGACALTVLVRDKVVTVACTGDCRAVLGTSSPFHNWLAQSLSSDQDITNRSEIQRLSMAHPGEEVIQNSRILGDLAPFRAFGNVHLKWDTKYQHHFFPVLLPDYLTPPYLIAEPVVKEYILTEDDRVLIVATDGLWERMSNKDAVSIVADVVRACDDPYSEEVDVTCHGRLNAATHILYHALGGSDRPVTKMLSFPPEQRRWHRDDITIMVVYL